MREDLVKKLSTFIFLRVVVVTLLLGSFYIFKIGYGRLHHLTALSYLIASLYLLSIIYAVVLRYIRNSLCFTLFGYTQIVIDIFAEAILIYLTGGIASWFSFLFPSSIVSSSILMNRRACYVIATLSSILYGLLLYLQFYGIIPLTTDIIFTVKEYFYNIFANITAFYLIAFLSGYLSERLYKTIKSLEEKEVVLSDLKVLRRDIIESMPSGVFTTDLDRRIVTFNSAAQRITRFNHNYVIGKRPEEIFPFLRNPDKPLRRMEGEIHSNGKILTLGIRLSTLKNSAGESIGMIGIFQDLTEVKEMETEMKKKEKWAFIGELSASIAHELRNPLASLKAAVEMLLEKKVSGQHADQLMKIAISEMDRLNGIVTDFLIYAKPEQLNKKPFDLHQSLREVVILLRGAETNEKSVKILSNLPGELLITGDHRRLHQVFWNLGINAIEAIPDKGTLEICTIRKNGLLEVVFKDTGIGLNREDMDKIFYPFFTTKEKGTGLGLSIAQRIVEEHEGKILVESETGAGTTFTVVLPLK